MSNLVPRVRQFLPQKNIGKSADSNLADKLSDEDLRALLLIIDAKNTLKTLRIGGCTQIVGHGLEPLRESTVLQCLSLPRLGNGVENALSIDIVIPIVVNIIKGPLDRLNELWWWIERVLKNLPDGWLREQSQIETSPLCEALTNISQMLHGEENALCSCGNPFIRASSCNNCGDTFCDNCEEDMAECRGCQSFYCSVCAQLDDIDAALECPNDGCDNKLLDIGKFCFGCILEGRNDAVNDAGFCPCGRCVAMHFPKVFVRQQTQQAEIAQLRQQIDQLQL